MTNPHFLSEPTAAFLAENAELIETVYVLGGTAAVSQGTALAEEWRKLLQDAADASVDRKRRARA